MTPLKHSPYASVRGPYLPMLKGLSHPGYFDYDRFFHFPWGHTSPPVNVMETSNSFEVELMVPGYDKKDFNISVDDNYLTVSAERKDKDGKREMKYAQKQFELDSFTRSFHLPVNASEEGVQAKYEGGVLTLTIGKKDITSRPPKKVVEVM